MIREDGGVRRRLRIIVVPLLAGLCIGAVGWILITTVFSNSAQLEEDARIQDAVVNALVGNCTVDLEARRQYKRRAVVERRLARLEARSNRLLSLANDYLSNVLAISLKRPDADATMREIAVGERGVALFERLSRVTAEISKLEKELADEIVILPIQKCEELRDHLVKLGAIDPPSE